MKGSIQQQLAVNNKTEQKELMVSMPSVMRTDAAANKARVSVHDPSVIKDGNTYYIFGSHIEAAKTNDLQNWKRFSNGYATTKLW